MWRTTLSCLAAVACGQAVAACGSQPTPAPASAAYTLVAEHPHDSSAYTQGLEFLDADTLVESTGGQGFSTIRRTDPATGTIIEVAPLPADHFGEGLTLVDGSEAWQLTWQAGQATRWRLDPLEPIITVAYQGEGWGLCLDDSTGTDQLIMSDGSATLTFRTPDDFSVIGTVDVSDGGAPVDRINELECVDGVVWANVWKTNDIIVIDPTTGNVVDRYDMSALVPDHLAGIDPADTDSVLNGIAHHPETGHLWLTGKNWPVIYEVTFTRSGSGGSG